MPILNNEMMRAIIMDHSSHPSNKREPLNKNEYETVHMHSDNCIDDINVYLKVENDIVVDACFEGIACTISLSSTDILCDLIKGKNKERALYMIEQYHHMLHEEEFDEEILEDANAFINTSKQAARIRCATIGWNAAEDILKKSK